MPINIKHYLNHDFDLYSPLQAILEATVGWRGDNSAVFVVGDEYFRIEATDMVFDSEGHLISGTINQILLQRMSETQWQETVYDITGLSLNVETALLAPIGTYSLAEGRDLFYDGSGLSGIEGTYGMTFAAASGDDTIAGGTGSDHLLGLAGDDSLSGSEGNDWLVGGAGRDTLNGGLDRDAADYSDKNKSVEVHLNGSKYATVKVGGIDEDRIKNVETLVGGTKADQLVGDKWDNLFAGGAGKDTIDGGAGDDTAFYIDAAGAVTVTLAGASYARVEIEGTSADKIRNIENVYGGAGRDKLTGDPGDNLLVGNFGADTLTGGDGHDDLFGGRGRDLLIGSSGIDYFYFDVAPSMASADVIKDFDTDEEKIVLSYDWLVSPLPQTGVLSKHFRHGTVAKDSNDFFIYDRSKGKLYYDDDGSGIHEQILIATLSNRPTLDHDDLWVV